MATQTMDASLASSHPDIAKRTSVSGLILSCAMLLAGVMSFLSIFQLTDRTSALSMGMMVLGSGLFLWGIFRLFWKTRELVYAPTGSVTKEQSCFFDLKHMDKLKTMVLSGKFSKEANMKSEVSGNIRMDILLSEDKKFAAVQLFQFIPYTYNPITPVCYFTNGEANELADFLLKCKMH